MAGIDSHLNLIEQLTYPRLNLYLQRYATAPIATTTIPARTPANAGTVKPAPDALFVVVEPGGWISEIACATNIGVGEGDAVGGTGVGVKGNNSVG